MLRIERVILETSGKKADDNAGEDSLPSVLSR